MIVSLLSGASPLLADAEALEAPVVFQGRHWIDFLNGPFESITTPLGLRFLAYLNREEQAAGVDTDAFSNKQLAHRKMVFDVQTSAQRNIALSIIQASIPHLISGIEPEKDLPLYFQTALYRYDQDQYVFLPLKPGDDEFSPENTGTVGDVFIDPGYSFACSPFTGA